MGISKQTLAKPNSPELSSKSKSTLLSGLRATMTKYSVNDKLNQSEEKASGTAATQQLLSSNFLPPFQEEDLTDLTVEYSRASSTEPSTTTDIPMLVDSQTMMLRDGRLTFGSLLKVTMEERTRLRMGIDERHKRAAGEFSSKANESGKGQAISLVPSRVLDNNIILCKDSLSHKYFLLDATYGEQSAIRLSKEEVATVFERARKSPMPYAKRFSDYKLTRPRMSHERLVAI